MAHEHAVAKRLPREMLRRTQTTRCNEMAFRINDVGITIHHTVAIVANLVSHTLQGIVGMQHIAGIEEYHIVALCQLQSLVHGIVQAIIALAHHDDIVATVLTFIFAHHSHGGIGGGSVHYDMPHISIALTGYAVERTLQHSLCVICAGYYGE